MSSVLRTLHYEQSPLMQSVQHGAETTYSGISVVHSTSAYNDAVMRQSNDGHDFQTRHYHDSPLRSVSRHHHDAFSATCPGDDETDTPTPTRYRYSSYADASTQYSPDGLPPTAPKEVATGHGLQKKRKQHGEDHDMDAQYTTSPRRVDRREPNLPDSAPVPSDTQIVAARDSAQTCHAGAMQTVAGSVPGADRDAADSLEPSSAVATVSKRSKSGTTNPKMMPEQYETCEAKDLGFLIGNMLLELIRINDDVPLRNGKLTRFHSRAPPAISCHDYLLRLIQHATLSPPILLSMVYYIDRLCALYSSFTINSLTVHRFLITAATVASKGLSDSFWTNVTYARIGGISTSELATLELDFLQRVDFRIVPKPETLVDYYRSLVQRSEGYMLELSAPGGQHDHRPEGLDVDMAG